MRAALYHQFEGPISLETLPDPEPTPTGVVIKVEATGVCRSDWHGWMGHDADIELPHVPGHEFAGVIEAVGASVTAWKVGERVTAPFVCGCGSCEFCRAGDQQVCPDQFQPGFTAWGSFAEYVMLEYAEENLVRLPENLDFLTAASLGCRFATSFRAVAHQARVEQGQWVAVHGCGGVGLSAVMIAHGLGARVIGVDLTTEKLDLARKAGAEITINASEIREVASSIRELTAGGAHASFDALGSIVTASNSIHCLRPRGKHVQIGLMTGAAAYSSVPFDMIVAKELELYGSHGMQAHCYPELFAMIGDGRLDPGLLVGRTASLEEALPALTSEQAFAAPGITVIDEI